MTNSKTTDTKTLRNHIKQEFTYNHLETLKEVAEGNYTGKRKDLITAFKAAGAKIRKTGSSHPDFKITLASGKEWLITLPMNIELHNGVNALSKAAKETLKECQKIISLNEQEPSVH
ncbi:MAG: hypothetical protein COB14_06995 [Alphaproteobacteria bacterium]|nr:MAG: hypothetical protein COB14_06995 [Alphaproteobacteria bacterium]